jgi:hypothetical protein
MDEIDAMYEKMLKESNDKRKQKEEELIKQKKQEKFDELKAEYDAEVENAGNNEGEEEKKEGEEGEEGEKPEKKKMPVLEEIQVELTPEELEDIWKSPDPDLMEKDAKI